MSQSDFFTLWEERKNQKRSAHNIAIKKPDLEPFQEQQKYFQKVMKRIAKKWEVSE